MSVRAAPMPLATYDHAIRRLWLQLQGLPQRLKEVHVWSARAAAPPVGVEAHMHTVPTLVACLNGVSRVTGGPAGRGQRHAVDLGPGDALLILPGVWHHHEPLRPGSSSYSQGFQAAFSDLLLVDQDARLWSKVPIEPSRRLAEAIVTATTPTARRAAVAALIDQVLAEPAEPLGRLHPALSAMIGTLWHRLHEPITARDVIAASGLGRSQAFALFQSYFGESPKRALTRQRLELARALLSEGFPVTEVAARCGFPTRATFTRLVRRELGAPPSLL